MPGYPEVRPGVGEVPRELPLVFRLLISFIMTAFSSLNCSSPAGTHRKLHIAAKLLGPIVDAI